MEEVNRGTAIVKKLVFILVSSRKTKGGIHQRGHIVTNSYLRLIRLDILRIIFSMLKKRISRACAKFEEIFPPELEPRIRLFQLHQDVMRNLLTCDFKCAADL